jgi:alpha-amylase/alpha-mannosidase (GH57 family)
MERYICIHGHFYQPPRENPWLEFIELQDSAYPYHDWNERITVECYAPNMASRILGAEGQITEIANNYAKISFNFGPTLLAWMELNAPDIYQSILEADRVAQRTFSGHGSALAQPYNHMILPLANRRDKRTQVLWGIRDFEHHFGRKPEGMWLPETAVNLETLEVLAGSGIRFTILAPRQARGVRRLRSREWQDVSGEKIDTTMAYTLRLPSGRSIALFFYDDTIARAVAFGGLLSEGEQVVQRLIGAFSEEGIRPQLVHIATDGETYGHHHRFGDMALAYALHCIECSNLAQITNYGEYLEKHPPTYEVAIIENTSWSCTHGVERWRSDCGCNSGMHPGWNQAWRASLREALDWLRDTLAPKYEEKAGVLLKDPWAARDDYIAVILDRSPESVERFLSQHAARELNEAEESTGLKLMELQRHAMLMYTSCGWFFDDLSGIETVQVMQYAGRVIQLAEELFGKAVEPRFLELLEQAKSNIPQHGDGRRIYEKSVKPAMVDLTKVAAHYAISSLFEQYGQPAKIYSYIIDLEDYQSFEAGVVRLAVGRANVFSEITRDSATLSFGVLHFGDHNLNAGVREYQGEEAYQLMVQEITQAFSRAEFPEVIRQLDKHFGASTYSLRHLFRDEQRKVLNRILESTLAEIETVYRQVYEFRYPLMRFLTDLGHPLPKAFRTAAEFILNTDLRRALSSDALDVERARSLLNEVRAWNVDLDSGGLGYLFRQTLEETMDRFVSQPDELSLLNTLTDAVALARSLPFEVNLWKVQNLYYEMLFINYPGFQRRAKKGDETAEEWVSHFISLAEQLSIQIPTWSS